MRLDDSELDALLAPMRDGPVALSGHGEGASRRQRLLPGVRAAVGATPGRLRRARRLRRAAIGASACGALLVAFVVNQLGDARTSAPPTALAMRVETLGSEPLTFVDSKGVPRTLSGDAAIDEPGELRAPAASWSRVLTAKGARIELAPRARLRVAKAQRVDRAPADAALRLERGEAHFSVPKLGAGAQFAIATPDADVVVHGTVFSVRVDPEIRRRTCVRVNEGLVEVRHDGTSTMLRPGMQWGCEEPSAALAAALGARPTAPVVEAAPSVPARATAKTELRVTKVGAARRRTARGTLDRETALLAAALAAEGEGDDTRARAAFSELLDRHPRSPLAPEARAGLARTRH